MSVLGYFFTPPAIAIFVLEAGFWDKNLGFLHTYRRRFLAGRWEIARCVSGFRSLLIQNRGRGLKNVMAGVGKE